VIEAALALGRAGSAQPVLDWLARTGIEDWHLRQLANRLVGSQPTAANPR
jgi:hypothetical protein